MAMGGGLQEPATWSDRLRTGASLGWKWASYPFTAGTTRHLHLVEQVRGIDGRAQLQGTAIEIISAQVTDISRDQQEIVKVLVSQNDMLERVNATLARLLAQADAASKINAETSLVASDVQRVLQVVASKGTELAEGLKGVQLGLAEEAVYTRTQIAALPSIEQVHALIGEGVLAQELVSTRTQLGDELQKMQQGLAVHSAAMHDQLASSRTQVADELRKVHDALAEHASGMHERFSTLASADHVRSLIEDGALVLDLASTRAQLADGLKQVHEVVAGQAAGIHERLATLPSTDQVQVLADGLSKVHDVVAEQAAGVNERLAALASTEQIHAVVNGGALVQDLASTRAQLADGLQKVHQVLTEHSAGVRDRLATLPSTEQVHALIEGGTASGMQGTRRLVAEEAQRGQALAERVAAKLDSLQSRSVIPLMSQGLVMCRNPLGFLAVPADDLVTIGSLADGVLPGQGLLRVVEKYLKVGGTFVDVGAGVGLFSLLAARVVGPAGKVIAIEPAPATANALRATVSANSLSNVVRIEEIAAGAERGLGTLSVEAICGHGSLIASDTATGKVVATVAPLDEILEGIVPDMVMIDVEGWELKVIEGMVSTIGANPDIILIMDFEPAHIRRTGVSAAAWVERMTFAGMQIFEIDERNGELAPLRKNGLEEIESINVVFARNDPSQRAALSAQEGWLWRGSAAAPAAPASRRPS
ncbi:MAG: FkbM family methyltransferase [Micropepsaceae bacterium]